MIKLLINKGGVIIRKIFIDNLPKRKYGNKEIIDWKNSINECVFYEYDNYKGCIHIDDFYDNFLIISNDVNKNYRIRVDSFIKCSLKNFLKIKTSEFKIEIGTTFKDEKRDLTIIDRKIIKKETIKNNKKYHQNFKYYKYKCNKCGFECGKNTKNKIKHEDYWIEESSILKGHGCACCCESPIITVEGINDIPTTAPWMVKYFQGGYNEAKKYTCKSKECIKPICPYCGKIKSKYINICDIFRNKSIGCNCNIKNNSYPEKLIMGLFETLDIHYIEQYSPKWIKPKRYDFYLPYYNIIIEMDGGFHYKDNNISGQTKEQSKQIDDYKDKIAKEHDIEVIRIDCNYKSNDKFEYVKNNIINSKLNDILKLNHVDWNYVENFIIDNYFNIQNSIIEKTCYMYTNDYDINTISKILNKNRSTIREYLKIGSKKGICNYNVNEAIKNRKEKAKIGLKKSNSKAISIYKNDVELYSFNSIKELKEFYINEYNIKFYEQYIKESILNDKPYKGFYFKYVNTEVTGYK